MKHLESRNPGNFYVYVLHRCPLTRQLTSVEGAYQTPTGKGESLGFLILILSVCWSLFQFCRIWDQEGQGRWNKKETKEPPNFLLCPEGILCIGQLLSSSWLAVGRLHRKNRAARGRGIGYVFRVFNLMRSCDRGEKNTNDPLPLLTYGRILFLCFPVMRQMGTVRELVFHEGESLWSLVWWSQ